MNTRHVLVVDDQEAITYLFRRYLEAAGFCVSTAADGVDALALLAREPVDALVTDTRMPRMGGEELVAQLRRLGAAAAPGSPAASLAQMPVVVVSAFPIESGAVEGNMRVFAKPVAGSVLVAALAGMLADRDTIALAGGMAAV